MSSGEQVHSHDSKSQFLVKPHLGQILQPVNHAGDACGSEAVVDVDHGHVAGTAIQHSERGISTSSWKSAVNIPPMANVMNDEQLRFNVHLVNDSIVSNPQTIEFLCAGELCDRRGKWGTRQACDAFHDP